MSTERGNELWKCKQGQVGDRNDGKGWSRGLGVGERWDG